MKHKKIIGLVACTAVAVILAGNIAVYAAGGTSTIVTVNVPVRTDYTMTIPATTSVTSYGTTELKNGLTISGTLADGDSVEVSISSQSEGVFKFTDEDNSHEIPYTLKNLSWTSEDEDNKITVLRKNLNKAIKLGVCVEQDDWNAVPGGTYSDILIFTAATVAERD